MKARICAAKAVTASLAVAVLLAFASIAAPAATYHVSLSSGNDTWTGQAESPEDHRGPWKTLARASTNYVAGDRLLLKCGDTWNEELHPQGSGTPANPITIGSYGGAKKPIIDREDYKKDLFGIHLADQAGYRIVGIEFARCMTGIYAEYSDGAPHRKGLWIEDCYFHDSLLYQHYEDYPKRKIGLGICLFSHECHNTIVLSDITLKNCVFRRLASGFWTNSPDNFNQAAGNTWNFGNLTMDGCLFEEGYQWPLGLRGIAGGAVRNCVTHDIGRNFHAFNGVAGAMIARCKNFLFENSEWGFISIGEPKRVSGDGEAFDFESNCTNMVMRNCLFHDTDGPGFLLCCYASGPEPEVAILLENCVLNGKAMRVKENGYPKAEILNTTDHNQVEWKNCRFYLSPGEQLYVTQEKIADKKEGMTFTKCRVKNLSDACSTPDLAAKATASASSQEPGHDEGKATDRNPLTFWQAASSSDQWLQLDFASPTTLDEFRIKETASSSVIRYVIECWDDRAARWVGCFNGRTIGPDFIAPIVSRTTRKVRLFIARTTSGNPCIAEFAAYNDTP